MIWAVAKEEKERDEDSSTRLLTKQVKRARDVAAAWQSARTTGGPCCDGQWVTCPLPKSDVGKSQTNGNGTENREQGLFRDRGIAKKGDLRMIQIAQPHPLVGNYVYVLKCLSTPYLGTYILKYPRVLST